MDQAAVGELLGLWGAWSRQDRPGPRVQTATGSAEGRYLATAGDTFADDREMREPDVADDLGMRVERAVCNAGRLFAIALTLYHVERLPVPAISRRLRVHDAGRVLDLAHAAVASRLG